MKQRFHLTADISPSRLISFSDGVFAIAITLLVFNLRVPTDIPPFYEHTLLPPQLRAMLPHFATYALTFLLVAIYWTSHHHMLNQVTHVDNRFIWINTYYLLTVSFIPFPAALIGAYPSALYSTILYLISMVSVGILSISLWGYASYKHRLTNPDLPRAISGYFFFRSAATIVIFLVTLILAFLHVPHVQYLPLLIVPMHIFARIHYIKKGKKEAEEQEVAIVNHHPE